MYGTDKRSEWANGFLKELGLDAMDLPLSSSILMSSEKALTSIEWDIAKILIEEFIFAISLLDTIIQDNGMKERSVFFGVSAALDKSRKWLYDFLPTIWEPRGLFFLIKKEKEKEKKLNCN